MAIDQETWNLIDELINYWRVRSSYEDYFSLAFRYDLSNYLKNLDPNTVRSNSSSFSTPNEDIALDEKRIVACLRHRLSQGDWESLPNIVACRRQHNEDQKRQVLEKKQREEQERKERDRQKRREQEAQAREEQKHRALERKQREKQTREEQKRRVLERKQREEQARKERGKRIEILKRSLVDIFREDFLSADTRFLNENFGGELITYEEFEQLKADFVREWARELEEELDPEQAAAVASTEGNVLVTARAGSGKTATLVNRALFLQQHCNVAPDEMLLLAFNRKAADEMRDRLTSYLQNSIPHVMTFHALAYALVHPEKILFDQPDGEESLSYVMQEVIDDYLRPNSGYYDAIRDLMLARFRDDWERIVSGGYDRTPEEMLSYRRSLRRESLDGKYVKSFGEKAIANFLFEHNIKYGYERNFWWDGINYRPDFTHFTGENCGIVIEYFGLAGDPDYDEMSEAKRNNWDNKPNWTLLEFSPNDLTSNGVEGFYTSLKQKLEEHGIPCNRLSEEAIWDSIKDRTIDRFTKVVRGFVQRCRKFCLTPEQLSEKVNKYNFDSDVEQRFLNVAQVFYRSYLERLEETGEDDFDGLMQKSSEIVAAGETVFRRKSGCGDLKRIRYVLIDEYQDFSELFHRLMQAVREQNSDANFFCVGDDWQAIYGFAGSNLHFFQNFSQVFRDSHKLDVTTNYRSAQAIVNVGNALMAGRGEPARSHKPIKGKVAIVDLCTFEPTPQEEAANPGDDFKPVVLRLVNKAINDNKNVVLLSRKNNLPWYVNYSNQENRSDKSGLDRLIEWIRARLPDELAQKVTISTVHKYKGLQKDVVIVLDAVDRCYPLIHPDLIFTRIFGDSVKNVVDEERRLFYVALTRAVEDLFILTEKGNFSPFLEDLERNTELSRLEWSDYPPLVGTTKSIAIRVGNQNGRGSNPTVAIKDWLNDEGYCWKPRSMTWDIVHPTEELSVEEFVNQASQTEWGKSADGIVVRFCDDLGNEIAKYHVDDGQWKCISGTIDNYSKITGSVSP